MRPPLPLRARLFLLILIPLIVLTVIASVVRYRIADGLAQSVYDGTLSITALTISRDVVLSEGDLLAEQLLERLMGALGDPIFYRVEGPDGRFLTGYSDSPPGVPREEPEPGKIAFYDSVYLGKPVRVAVLREFIVGANHSGWTTVEVWQTVFQREMLRKRLFHWTLGLMLAVLVVSSLTVWFGIHRGLRPLAVIRQQLLRRSPSDLRPIEQNAPAEITPLLEANNMLLRRVSETLAERDAFISNAAHQLRNPIAGLQAQAESAASARSETEVRRRILQVVDTARRASRLTKQLLALDHAANQPHPFVIENVDLGKLAANVLERHATDALLRGIEVEYVCSPETINVKCDPSFVGEAVENLIDNAMRYGCQEGGTVRVGVDQRDGLAIVSVCDDGPGISVEHRERIFERFYRVSDTEPDGCGLGLAISRLVAEKFGGTVALKASQDRGCCFELSLPTVPSADSA